jgi:transposase
MWIPPENIDPVVYLSPTRKNIGVMGAVCPNDGRFIKEFMPVFNADTFLFFLRKLLKRKINQKLILVLDNARWHHAKALKPWLDKHQESIQLLFLPPYCPHLNPIERVWKLTRYNCTHNQYFNSMTDLHKNINTQFNKWTKPNMILRKLCAIN